MSTEKFVHMMLTKSLFVPKLRLFDDQREGALVEQIFNQHYARMDPSLGELAFERARDRFYALCFHGKKSENELMWRSYAPLGGVAIVTSTSRLMSAGFTVADRDSPSRDFYLLRVLYGDSIPGRVHPVAVMQDEYKSEDEFRMVFADSGPMVRTNLSAACPRRRDPGLVLQFSLEDFLETFDRVIISPNNGRIVEEIASSFLPVDVLQKSRIARQ